MIRSATDSSNVENCVSPSNGHGNGQRNGKHGHVNGHGNGRGNGHRNGYGRDLCSIRNPCRNGGICRSHVSSVLAAFEAFRRVKGIVFQGDDYTCECPSEFTGRDCEHEANMCDVLQPCKNDGDCIGDAASYKCQCSFGWTGPNCEESKNRAVTSSVSQRTNSIEHFAFPGISISESIRFQGDGYAELNEQARSLLSGQDVNQIKVQFSTDGGDGLLLWHGQSSGESGHGQDYLAIAGNR